MAMYYHVPYMIMIGLCQGPFITTQCLCHGYLSPCALYDCTRDFAKVSSTTIYCFQLILLLSLALYQSSQFMVMYYHVPYMIMIGLCQVLSSPHSAYVMAIYHPVPYMIIPGTLLRSPVPPYTAQSPSMITTMQLSYIYDNHTVATIHDHYMAINPSGLTEYYLLL